MFFNRGDYGNGTQGMNFKINFVGFISTGKIEGAACKAAPLQKLIKTIFPVVGGYPVTGYRLLFGLCDAFDVQMFFASRQKQSY